MGETFATKLDRLIEEHLELATDDEKSEISKIISDLELKIMALKEDLAE